MRFRLRAMPDEPTHVFLSYGVRDASDVAERLHRDLTARGYKIWQDIERIRTGWAWDNELEDGLLTSKVVLALLSPHAVRRALDTDNVSQVDSVCLDEIAFARFRCKIPIVPVKVRPCEAPFLIYRLQHIDFRRWNESEPVYQAGLDHIYEAIGAARRGEKRERTWGWLPKPWDFEPFLREKRKDFVGREWLFAEIEEWQVRGVQPALLITVNRVLANRQSSLPWSMKTPVARFSRITAARPIRLPRSIRRALCAISPQCFPAGWMTMLRC